MGDSYTGWVWWSEKAGLPPQWVFGELAIRDGRIEALHPCAVEARFPTDCAEEVRPGADETRWITPGFVDLHCHLAIESHGSAEAEQVYRNALVEVRSGILAIRQPGTPVRINTSDLPFGRPIVVDSGRHIALEKRYSRGLAVELQPGDRKALLAEVRRQAHLGDGWVKLVGDWIDRSVGDRADLQPLWSRDDLHAAVETAGEEGARVAVHTFGQGAIDDLLDAGVGSIEHGSGMTLEQMRRAADAGIPVIPTLGQVIKFPEFASAATRYPVYARTMAGLYERRHAWFEDLLDSGVQLLPGSDAGGYQRHGSLIPELQMWVEWGMPPEDVFASATWKARDFLGLESLSIGSPADVLVFDEDPVTNPHIWSSPSQVVAAGHLV